MSNAKKQWDAHVEGALAAKDSIAVVDLDWDAAVLYAHQRIAELEAQLADKEGWQSIETAPRDKRVILLHRISNGRTADGLWNGDCWAWPYVLLEPTHWMPLPAAPDSAT